MHKFPPQSCTADRTKSAQPAAMIVCRPPCHQSAAREQRSAWATLPASPVQQLSASTIPSHQAFRYQSGPGHGSFQLHRRTLNLAPKDSTSSVQFAAAASDGPTQVA